MAPPWGRLPEEPRRSSRASTSAIAGFSWLAGQMLRRQQHNTSASDLGGAGCRGGTAAEVPRLHPCHRWPPSLAGHILFAAQHSNSTRRHTLTEHLLHDMSSSALSVACRIRCCAGGTSSQLQAINTKRIQCRDSFAVTAEQRTGCCHGSWRPTGRPTQWPPAR